jgi:hypothetical protein
LHTALVPDEREAGVITGGEFVYSDVAALLAAAEKMRPGKERDRLLSKALAPEAVAEMEKWINSPGLQPPKTG